jgi:MinD superfamily P-loop ATPase
VPLIKQTHEYIDKKFTNDVIRIYDSPPGTSCPVIEATKDADFVILVTEPTPFGLHDLKLAIETMKELKKKFGVVVNRYGIGNDDVLDYCKNENIPLLAKIPNDRRIAELYSKGSLIYREFPEVRQQLEHIKDYIDAINK